LFTVIFRKLKYLNYLKKTGLLFVPDDSANLADKIIETLQTKNLVQNRVKAAKQNISRYHTMDAMGRNIIRIY